MLRRIREIWAQVSTLAARYWAWIVAAVALALVATWGARRKSAAKTAPHPLEREQGRHEGAAESYEQQARAAGERAERLEAESQPRPAEPAPSNLEDLSDEALADLFNSRNR